MTGHDAADLGEFVRTGSQPAFERVARRYAAMVYAACLCRLGSPEDAEDASQAVFLALARKARSVSPETLGSWLHGAAMRAATFVLRSRGRRARHEEEAARMRSASSESAVPEFVELRPHLGAAVEELPRKLREAVTRHYFAGQSRAEIARELGLPEGTVASRVSAGLEKLRGRLERRGACCGLAALGTLLAGFGGTGAPASLLASLPALASGGTAALAAAGCGSNVVAIAEGVLRVMFWGRVRVVAAIAVAVLVLGVGAPVTVLAAVSGGDSAVEALRVGAGSAKPATSPAPEAGKAVKGESPRPPEVVLAPGISAECRGGPTLATTGRVWVKNTGKVPLWMPLYTVRVLAKNRDNNNVVELVKLTYDYAAAKKSRDNMGIVDVAAGVAGRGGAGMGIGPGEGEAFDIARAAPFQVGPGSFAGFLMPRLSTYPALKSGKHIIWAEVESNPVAGIAAPDGAVLWTGRAKSREIVFESKPKDERKEKSDEF